MRRFLSLALAGLLWSAPALADSDVPSLSSATTLVSSLMYVAQGGTTNTKLAFNTSAFCISSAALTICPGGVTASMLANTSVTPATYGDSTHVMSCTIDQQGRATSCSNVAISGGGGGSLSVTAGGTTDAATTSLTLIGFTMDDSTPGSPSITQTNLINSPADGGSHTYAIVAGDATKQVILASTFTGTTLSQATGSFGSGFAVTLTPKAAITLTATTSKINNIAGGTGIKIGAYQSVFIASDGTDYNVVLGEPQCATQTGTTFIRDDGTCATPSGSGNVTAAGTLTSGGVVIGGGTQAVVTAADITFATGILSLGTNTSELGGVKMFGSTSGNVTIEPNAVAGTNIVLTLPATTDTLVGKTTTDTLTNKTLTSPTMTAPVLGTPASGTLTNATGLPAASVVSGALANGMTATTQSAASNDTKVATDAYVDAKQFTATVGWIATVNPTGALVFVAPAALTIKSIVGNVEVASGGTSTVSVFKAPSATPCGSGTIQHSGSFNANGTAATNQTLTLVGGAGNVLAAGDRICITTTGTTGWTAGTGVGGITVAYTVP